MAFLKISQEKLVTRSFANTQITRVCCMFSSVPQSMQSSHGRILTQSSLQKTTPRTLSEAGAETHSVIRFSSDPKMEISWNLKQLNN